MAGADKRLARVRQKGGGLVCAGLLLLSLLWAGVCWAAAALSRRGG